MADIRPHYANPKARGSYLDPEDQPFVERVPREEIFARLEPVMSKGLASGRAVPVGSDEAWLRAASGTQPGLNALIAALRAYLQPSSMTKTQALTYEEKR